MPSVTIRFYEELNLFLPPALRKGPVNVTCARDSTVKAVIEDLGVPHTEVDLVLVNGTSVGFSCRLHEHDRVSVYPVFESLDISGITRVRSTPLRETRFALDAHLGKLARLLRMFGFDSFYETDLPDEDLVRRSRAENRIILTRDRGLLKRRLVTHGYLVRATEPQAQIAEVLRRFDLAATVKPFGRCMRCNGTLVKCAKEEIAASLPPVVAQVYQEFSRCTSCGRVFWKGTHWERMKKLAGEVLGEIPAGIAGPR